MKNQQIRTDSQLNNQQQPLPLQPLNLEQLDVVSGGTRTGGGGGGGGADIIVFDIVDSVKPR
jgi:hypothetical protein